MRAESVVAPASATPSSADPVGELGGVDQVAVVAERDSGRRSAWSRNVGCAFSQVDAPVVE